MTAFAAGGDGDQYWKIIEERTMGAQLFRLSAVAVALGKKELKPGCA